MSDFINKNIYLIFVFVLFLKEILNQSLPKNHIVKENKSNVTFEFYEDKVNISIYKNKTKVDTNETFIANIQAKLISIKEIFPNGLSYIVALPKFKLIDLNKLYTEQSVVDCIKSDIIGENILGNDEILNKTSSINITYKFFNDSGWIDENTNYIQRGNIFLETRVINYPFCENIINEYNEKNHTTNNLNLELYQNCKDNWKWNNSTKKYIEIPNPNSNKKNSSYLEMTYSFTTNDKTKFKYDIEAGGIPNQTEGNSYMRIYRQIYTDKQLDYQLPGYPIISDSEDKLTVRFNKFNEWTINWIFFDIDYKKPPENYRNLSTMLTYILIGVLILSIIICIIKRKIRKDGLVKDEKSHNLNDL